MEKKNKEKEKNGKEYEEEKQDKDCANFLLKDNAQKKKEDEGGEKGGERGRRMNEEKGQGKGERRRIRATCQLHAHKHTCHMIINVGAGARGRNV